MASRVWNPTGVYITDVVGAKATPSGLIVIIAVIKSKDTLIIFIVVGYTNVFLEKAGFCRGFPFPKLLVIDEL